MELDQDHSFHPLTDLQQDPQHSFPRYAFDPWFCIPYQMISPQWYYSDNLYTLKTEEECIASFPPPHTTDPTLDPKNVNVVQNTKCMERFPLEGVNNFKHVIYNLLVDYHNTHSSKSLVKPCQLKDREGELREGFCFNESECPEKKIAELYAKYIRKTNIEIEDQSSVIIQDIYKFYLRACTELLSKYFQKVDKYTYLYDDSPLFKPGGSLFEAEIRIKNMKSLNRIKKRKVVHSARQTISRKKRASLH